ncbi:MAG: Crp/Fnr family transcriptional regulator [Desulfovibrionaceae bacterium]|nr:Crp/Fnr family transcriptional regulator [Desulfovibrionaceae bacterium]
MPKIREEGEKHAERPAEIFMEDINTPWYEARHLGTRLVFPKGHIIFSSSLQGLHFIASGSFRLTYLGANGEERGRLHLGRGCLFNEIPTLLGDFRYNVVFRCLEASEVWRFDTALLENMEFLAAFPHLIANLLRSMAEKSYTFFYSSMQTSGTSMRRLCALLLQMCGQNKPRMSQNDVANMLGLHQTTVARLIHRLRKEGVIAKFTKNELQILDMARLRELACCPSHEKRHDRGRPSNESR